MDQEQAMELVQPLLALWHEGWHFSHAKYVSYPVDVTVDHDDTTTAACIRSHMWTWLQNNMLDIPGVDLIRAGATRQLPLLNYRGVALARFKKVDASGRHANYRTGQQDDFDRQRPLPGLPNAAVRLTCGYEPLPAGDSIRRIIISHVYGRTVLWASQVNVADDVAAWDDITPARFAGTRRIQDRPRRAG